MSVTYSLDTSGVNPANLVPLELHSVNEAKFRDFFFIVPNLAPFFVDNFQLYTVANGTKTLLVEDVDFSFTLPYVTGTRTTGKQMYGGVTLHNLQMSGILAMNYQTIGGNQVADRLYVLSYLADKVYNPATTIWDIITDVPGAFPPVPHYQDYDQFKGQDAVVQKLSEIATAILTNSSLTSSSIQMFLDEFLQGSSAVYVKKGGDAMTGPLTLSGPPIYPMHAATKAFVEQSTINTTTLGNILLNYATEAVLASNMDTKLSLTGGVMTGPIKLSGDPVVAEDAVRKAYMDGVISGLTTRIDALQTTVNNLNTVGASKAYVDDLIAQVMVGVNLTGLHRS